MPTIAVDKAELYKSLGREYTKDEFDELCFEFGIELDEDTSESKRPIVDGVEERPQLKIEIPANRYDMLCFEGIAMNLNIFLGRQSIPNYRLVPPTNGELLTVNVSEDTARIRPYFSCAILRNIKFDKARYESLPFRTNCTKTWLDSERWLPLVPMTWTQLKAPSHMKLFHRSRSNSRR